VDTVEIFANDTFDVPTPKGVTPTMTPALCFSARVAPPARCLAALGGVRPLQAATAGSKISITVDVSDVTPAALLARQRPGATGRDLWLVARATGSVGLFPVIPGGVDAKSTTVDELVAGNLAGRGVPALAFTNPVYVDVDGNGWRAPFAP